MSDETPQANQPPNTVSRRGFLQAAAAGTILVGTTGVVALSGATNRTTPPAAQTEAATATPMPTNTPAPTLPPVDPKTALDTWIEPWVWRPSDWPGQQLDLYVVENANPVSVVGLGNPSAILFNYGGNTPGPTIRMKGNETLFIRLRNMLGRNNGTLFVKQYPDPNELPPGLAQKTVNDQARKLGNERHDFCLGEHTNGQHAARTTNLHTHGLHVRPGRNPDGTHSDNIILRVMPQADLRARQESEDPTCLFLGPNEQVGEADYEFRIGDVMGNPNQPHPPGTHWYHPHSHGSTHNQVSSGMAGFLIVEGAEDEAINQAFTGKPNPDPAFKTGDYDYRERLMFMQRVIPFFPAVDPDSEDAQQKNPQLPPQPAINGNNQPRTIVMRPGAVERWRVLNGSVDGRGYKRFMVVEGEYAIDPNGYLARVAADGKLVPTSIQELEDNKQVLYQMAMDGVTLVEMVGGTAKYVVRNLDEQNKGSTNPLAGPIDPDNPNQSLLDNFQACYTDGQAIFDTYVRPNEVYMAPANRADLFFQAPRDGADKVYTVLAKAVVVHADTYQQGLQKTLASKDPTKPAPAPQDIVLAYLAVTGDPVKSIDVEATVQKVFDQIKVPPYLLPIPAEEVMVTGDVPKEVGEHMVTVAQSGTAVTNEKKVNVAAGQYRTRSISYSGWGAQGFPLVTDHGLPDKATSDAFAQFIADNPDLVNLVYTEVTTKNETFNVLMPPYTRTMAINNQFTTFFTEGERPSPRKFDPSDMSRPIMLVGGSEEWALYNGSISLWGDTSEKLYLNHFVGRPLLRADGQTEFSANPNVQIVTRAIDHPFHMHINPFWVMRIEVPDQHGNLVNILEKPRWQDTVWIPRDGGRVVFRSRFADFAGVYVNHCHLLLHEDNGMMTAVETTFVPERANYIPSDAVISDDATSEEVNELYPVADDPNDPQARLLTFYQQSSNFVDPNATGQVYPTFRLEPPL